MVRQILKYLGYPSEEHADGATLELIQRALKEVEHETVFQYQYGRFDKPQEFMLNSSAYMEFLAGTDEYLLCATTLGVQVDRRLKRLESQDMAYAVVFDATASVYLENLADAREQEIAGYAWGGRFCPGYGGTSLSDNSIIASLLRADRIGITFLESGLMIPMKSMMGIVRLGGKPRKSCKGCVASAGCPYRSKGTTCWS